MNDLNKNECQRQPTAFIIVLSILVWKGHRAANAVSYKGPWPRSRYSFVSLDVTHVETSFHLCPVKPGFSHIALPWTQLRSIVWSWFGNGKWSFSSQFMADGRVGMREDEGEGGGEKASVSSSQGLPGPLYRDTGPIRHALPFFVVS